MSSRRAIVLAISAAAILAVEIGTADFRDIEARIRMAMAAHDLVRDRSNGTDFLFDRGYGAFLERVGKTAAPGAPVEICVPRTNELYDYAAAYVLAPRPVHRAATGFAYRCPERPGP